MIMKNIRFFVAALAAILCTVGCSLDEKNFTEIEKSTYMTTPEEAQTVLLGVYRNMQNDAMYSMNLSLYFTLGTDEAKVEGSSPNSWRDVPSNTYSTSNSYVEATWQALYNAVYDANDFIENLSRRVTTDSWKDNQDIAAIYMAEARTLRALFYFELVRWYGTPVLMKTTAESNTHPSLYTQPDPKEVYEFIEQDLKYAAEVLPWAVDDTYRSDTQYRVSKGTALGLLAKVYATWAGYPLRDESKWEAAANTAKILVESGKHHLLDSYETLWQNTCNNTWDPEESLLEVSFYASAITGSDPIGRIGKWNGVTATDGAGDYIRIAANWKVLPTFIASWPDHTQDKRWALSFADYKYTSTGKTALGTYTEDGSTVKKDLTMEVAMRSDAKPEWRKPFNNALTPGKWDLEKYVKEQVADANYSDVNWYLLRYADVLLLYAEALNEWHKSPTTDAYSAINMVRRRAYGLPVNTPSSVCDLSGMSYEQFRQAVRDERGYELAFEGHRKQDLVRWGIYYETIRSTAEDLATWHEQMPSLYIISEYTVKGRHELLPIPQRDLDMMPQCKQNEGWR